jgi:hypothetical protein
MATGLTNKCVHGKFVLFCRVCDYGGFVAALEGRSISIPITPKAPWIMMTEPREWPEEHVPDVPLSERGFGV